MSALAKPLLGILLLAFAGVSWAACPEGQKQTYKGCEVVEEKATEAQPAVQQEAKEVDSEILELGGFIAEEIQIEAAAGQGDTTEMTASLDWDNEGDDWRGIGFNQSRMKQRYLPESHTDFILSPIIGRIIFSNCYTNSHCIFDWLFEHFSLFPITPSIIK